jgi:hypothetical protein
MIILATTAIAGFGIVSPYSLLWDPEPTLKQFQLWRLFSSFCFLGMPSFGWLMNLLFLWQYSSQLEKEGFTGVHATADYCCLLLFGAAVLLSSSAILPNLMIYGPSLLMLLVHVSCRKDPFRPVNFWGFSFLSWHFPFILLVMHSILMGGGMRSALTDLLGIVTGHLYLFLTDILPKVKGITLLETPQWLCWLVEQGIPKLSNQISRGFGGRVVRVDQPGQSHWSRSRGYRLGGQ